MRFTSFRARVFVLSIILAVAVVAGVLVTSYVIVSTTMEEVARTEAARTARGAWDLVRSSVNESLLQARQAGLSGYEMRTSAYLKFVASVPERFGVAGNLVGGHFAFYRMGRAEQLWYPSDQKAIISDPAGRLRAVTNRQPTEVRASGNTALEMLFAVHPDLGTYVVHIPFQDPNEEWWVLDVAYIPVPEQEAIERIRLPLLLLSIAAVVLTVLIMQLNLGWVLQLINDLRTAAESVDAEELGVRLPESGGNEIGDLARSLNGLIGKLQARSDAQARFVADASHELSTPVAGIRGYVNILRGWGAEDSAVREEAVAAIDRESRRMARLTTQLLELIRADEVLELHSQRHDLNEVIRAVIDETTSRYKDKSLEFIEPDPGPLVVFGDPGRMEDVISILVDNAAKYTPAGGRVSVQTYRRRGDFVIEVSDTGPGIRSEDLANIFERFYRSDASRSADSGGFGLGLSIAKRIIDSSGGLIDVRSDLGKGTTFTIRLPRGRD